ncbi:F-box/kelch-repeat protein [Cardamine amara subsp. amara]|uniref:F-box/kelch-repeat protein n=1 Tax=Cardamine amara subsp. amara TaxID=228776 RepID=A0ABD0ZA61_CARAN
MNPSTREVLRFPSGPADVVKNERYDHMDDYWDYFPGDWAMGFGKDKVNGSYKVVRMFFDTNQFDILDVDIGEWRKLRSPSPLPCIKRTLEGSPSV